MMRQITALPLMLCLTALAPCLSACGTFGPDRRPPNMTLPSRYAAAVPAETGAAAAARIALGGSPVPRWWTTYECPPLDALVEEALAHNPSLAAARASLTAAREQLRSQIGDNALPHLDAGVQSSRQRALELPFLPQQTAIYDVFAAQAQLSYTFDFFGAAVLADRSLAGQVQRQAYELESLRRSLAAEVVLATIDAASLEAQLEASERLVAAVERRAAQNAERSAQGGLSRADALASEADAAAAQGRLPPLRARLLAVRHAQAVLLGRNPQDAPAPLALEALHLPGPVPVQVPSDLLHERPDILAAEAAVRAAADAAGAATASMFPSLTLSAAYGRGGFDWSTFASPAGALWSAGALITQPLFHGGALAARRRQYQASYEAAVAQYRQTVLSAFQNVADTLVALETDEAALAQARRGAAATRALRDDLDARHQLGSAPLVAALTAREQHESTQLELIRAEAARLADTANLYQALGDATLAANEPVRRSVALAR